MSHGCHQVGFNSLNGPLVFRSGGGRGRGALVCVPKVREVTIDRRKTNNTDMSDVGVDLVWGRILGLTGKEVQDISSQWGY